MTPRTATTLLTHPVNKLKVAQLNEERSSAVLYLFLVLVFVQFRNPSPTLAEILVLVAHAPLLLSVTDVGMETFDAGSLCA